MQRKRFPYFHNGRFANYPGEDHGRMLWRAVKSFSRLVFCRYKRLKENLNSWTQNLAINDPTHKGDLIAWLGHSTFFIRFNGVTIITDPVFADLSLIFKRMSPAITLDLLPKVDVVLLSHNHRDHMDEPALRVLEQRDKPQFFVPVGDGAWFKKRGYAHVTESFWWDQFSLFDTIRLTFLPARHWSQRGFFDRNKSLWGGWMVEKRGEHSKTIYFAGDTAYGDHFTAIGQEFSSIDIALMPIGPTAPHELMRHSHVNTEEACQAFIDTGARVMIPMHWGTYRLGTEHPLDPLKRLKKWWANYGTSAADRQLLLMRIGQSVSLVHPDPQVSQEKITGFYDVSGRDGRI